MFIKSRKHLFKYALPFLAITFFFFVFSSSANADNASQSSESASIVQTYVPSNYKGNNGTTTQTNPLITTFSTAYGNAGISKVWISGGSIWFSVKLYNYPTYNWVGNLHIAYTNGKTRNLSVGGFGYAGETWVGHKSIGSVGKHGTATLSGTAISVDGRRASVLHPSSAF